MTQNEKVLHHLETYGSITPLEALEGYGIMRLASRITDLKKEGVLITRELKTYKNRFGETVRYAVYRLKEECLWLTERRCARCWTQSKMA